MTADALRYRIARALYNEGASCGECRSYSGWDSCDECRRHVLDLADEVLAVLADADPTDLADALAALGHQPRPGRSVDPNPFPRIRLFRHPKETS